jgi:hypothetical protein
VPLPDPGRAAKLNGKVSSVGGGLGLGDPPGEECPPTHRAQHPRAA